MKASEFEIEPLDDGRALVIGFDLGNRRVFDVLTKGEYADLRNEGSYEALLEKYERWWFKGRVKTRDAFHEFPDFAWDRYIMAAYLECDRSTVGKHAKGGVAAGELVQVETGDDLLAWKLAPKREPLEP